MSFEEKLNEVHKQFNEKFWWRGQGVENKFSAGECLEIWDFVNSTLIQCREDTVREVKKMITEEINIVRSENQPTSRLTALFVKLDNI